MSYILDALRKAEAERERERGQVPGIHAQQPLPSALPAGAPPAGTPRWVWLGGGAVLVVAVAAGLAWWGLGGASPSARAPTLAAVAPTAVPVTTTPPLPATEPAPLAQPPVRKPKPAATAAEPARTAAGATLPAPAPTPGTARGQAPANGEPSGPIPGKIYALTELPDDVRSQLPKLTVGGSMYSPVRENRVLIVNGQVAQEGATIAPNVVLEQVRVRSAILQFRGYRYSLPF